MAKVIIVLLMLCLTYVNCQLSQGCQDAAAATSMPTCAIPLAAQNDAVCSGTCVNVFNTYATECGINNPAFEALCINNNNNYDVHCVTELIGLLACFSLYGTSPTHNSSAVLCSGDCHKLSQTFSTSCSGADDASAREFYQLYNSLCSGVGAVKGLGFFSMLLVAVIAYVMCG